MEPCGIIIIDKPAGITSAGVVARVKRILKVKKAGHCGTLDPFATGVVIICVNRATKLAGFFLKDGKKYEATLELGKETDTQDPEGKVVSTCEVNDFSMETIRDAFKRFEGDIEQSPPAFSALKHEGTPLYKLARKGKPVQKPPRPVRISRLSILDVDLPEIRFEVECSAGTYVRTLAADIGTALGCGAYLKELRRTGSSGFSIKEALTISELEETASAGKIREKMIPMGGALRHMPVRIADSALEKKIMHGQRVAWDEIKPRTDEGFLQVVDSENNLLAVMEYEKIGKTYNYCCVFPK